MTSDGNQFEAIFKEHSFDEIKLVRDNLASEIEKQTELLKSTVKSKYNDIIETSDAIKSMKANLKTTEQSLWSLNREIGSFYIRIREPRVPKTNIGEVQAAKSQDDEDNEHKGKTFLKDIISKSSELWEHFDSGDLKSSVRIYSEATEMLSNQKRGNIPPEQAPIIANIETSFDRARDMIKNHIWHKIQTAGPEKTGIIPGCELDDLYKLSLGSSMDFLAERMKKELEDVSFQAQIRRFQRLSYFNTTTNEIEPNVDDTKGLGPNYVQIPKSISPELNTFLYESCRVINIVAGLNLNRRSIIDSLSTCIERTLEAYSSLARVVNGLKPEVKRKRAKQLYFDLLYLRIILNSAKSFELIEKLDHRITEIANSYELMLDSIELYMISESLMSNVVQLSKSTIRLFGLLIPHLQ